MTKLIPQCTRTFFLDIFLCIPSKLREWKKSPSTLLAIVISLDCDVSRQKPFASRIMSSKNWFLEPPRWLGTCLNYRENDPIACFICKYISVVKSSLLCDLKILIKDWNLKIYWRLPRMKKKGLFQRGFTREETGKQLAGTYCINKKVEDKLHLAGIENSFTKWYKPEIKALTWSQILTKCYF